MPINIRFITIKLLCTSILCASHAHAQSTPAIQGFLGLNTVPNARMDEVATLRSGLSTLDPYLHGYIGVQIAAPLYINFRQSAEISNISKNPDRLYPGIDLKLRLAKETARRPEISIGMQSALGHKKMAGEYIALSKRYKDLDFTLGMGWGRYGQAANMGNPLKIFSPHFKKDRDPNSNTPNGLSNWFSGDSVGIFGGIEYAFPIDGLSLKLDYGTDRYQAEQQDFDYNPPSPWGAGLSYNYRGWAEGQIGIQGTDKIMGRISLKSHPSQWPFGTWKNTKPPKPLYKERGEALSITKMIQSTKNDDIALNNIRASAQTLSAELELENDISAPAQIGRAINHITNNSGPHIEEIKIRTRYKNLLGPVLSLLRKDVENSVGINHGSPQELWHNADFVVTQGQINLPRLHLSTYGINSKRRSSIILENQLSLSERDHGILYRSSALIETHSSSFLGLSTGSSLRVNLKDNLDKLDDYRQTSPTPTRSDIDEFTKKRISLENSYLAYAHSFTPELHILASAGYLDEFYGGAGAEMLYRPFASRLAFGAQIWRLSRRAPDTFINLGLNGTKTTSGFISGWYDIPNINSTINVRAGRFLAGDSGISLGLDKIFKNGAKLSGSINLSNYNETDLFGGTTHTYHSLKLTMPLGNTKLLPRGSEVRTKISPMGRDTAQQLNQPLNLYDMTNQMNLNHMAKYWNEILE